MTEECIGEIEFFKPETRLCILLLNRCKKKPMLELDFVEEATNDMNDYYTNFESAKKMIRKNLKLFEEKGLIKLVQISGKGTYIKLEKLRQQNTLGSVKITRVFSNNIVILFIITCLLMFLVSMFLASLEFVVASAICIGFLSLIIATSKEKFVFG